MTTATAWGRAAVVASALWAAAPARAADPADRPAPLDRIRDEVRQSRTRTRDLWAEYLFTVRDPVTGRPAPETSRSVIAAKGVRRYLRISHFSEVMAEEYDTKVSMGYYTGTQHNVYYPAGRLYEVTEERPPHISSWALRCDLLLDCIGWWPPEDPSLPPEELRSCLDWILAQPGCFVRPRRERAGGAWCDVVERPGRDVLWLDPAAGYALRRRDVFVFDPPVLAMRYELSDHREVAPGVWLPWAIRRTLFDARRAGAATVPVVARDGDCQLVAARVNSVPDSQFEFVPPAGTVINDRTAARHLQVPGGLDLLDEVAGVAANRLRVYRERSAAPAAPAGGWGAAVLVLAALNAGLVAALVRRHAFARRPVPARAHP